MKNTTTTKESIEAWDMYCDGNYKSIVDNFQSNQAPDMINLVEMADWELGQSTPIASTPSQQSPKPNVNGLFVKLRNGMLAFHNRDYKTSSKLLADWLLTKQYFSESIMDRFLQSALKSESHELTLVVCQKYFLKNGYKQQLSEAFFLSLFHTQKYKQAIQLFESHQEFFSSTHVLHKVALSCITQKKYEQAEALLLPLVEKISGKPYRNHFEERKKEFSNPSRIQQLENNKHKNKSENMEYGLTLLFNKKYNQALKIFQKIKV